MMTENATQQPNSRKLTRLDIYFVVNTNNEEDSETSLENLPRWTVINNGKEYQIREGIALVEDALARRFKTLESKDYVVVSVAIDFRTQKINPAF